MPIKTTVEFPADIYSQYRPFYPPQLFALMRTWMDEYSLSRPVDVVDIGCGTGHSTLGLLQAGFAKRLYAIEPSTAMIEEAKSHEILQKGGVEFIQSGGEETGLETASVDVIFCASAFHWMNRDRATEEFFRILRQPGLIVFAEYRFPRAQNHDAFNDWIKAKLYGEWEIPELSSRDSFAKMVSGFGERPNVTHLGVVPVPMHQALLWQDIFGLLRSQSRYVKALAKLIDKDERQRFEKSVEESVHRLLGDQTDLYDFRLQAAGFAVAPC